MKWLVLVCMLVSLSTMPAEAQWTPVLTKNFATYVPQGQDPSRTWWGPFPHGNGGQVYFFQMEWGLAMLWPIPSAPCQADPTTVAGPCDPQTNRWTVMEWGTNEPGFITASAGRRLRTEWLVLTSADPSAPASVTPIIWQAFHQYSHRIFSCPPVAVDYTRWVTITCEIDLPSVEGLILGPGNGVGFGLDLATPWPFALDIVDLKINVR